MRGSIPAIQREKLAAELAQLESLDSSQLRTRWNTLYDTPPPRCFRRGLLIHAIAYWMQERVFGGLSLSTRQVLARVTDQIKSGSGSRFNRRVSSNPAPFWFANGAESAIALQFSTMVCCSRTRSTDRSQR